MGLADVSLPALRLPTVNGPLAGAADTTTAFYDADRQLIGVIGADPDGAGARRRIAQRTTYDAAGRVLRQATGTVDQATQAALDTLIALDSPAIEQLVDRAYDAYGRLVDQAVYGKGIVAVSREQYSYTADGLLDCAAVRMNPAVYGGLPASACTMGQAGADGPDRISKNTYDALGRVVTLRTGVGTSAVVDETGGYTPDGRRSWVADGKGNKTSYYYDGHDRLFGLAMPDRATPGVSSTVDAESYQYDANGNLVSQRLRDGTVVTRTYDALNRMVSRTAGAADLELYYAYDTVGRLVAASDTANVFWAAGYDALGRKVSETSFGRTVTSAYDAGGRRTRFTWHDGFYVDYTYSATGEMLEVRENGARSGVGVLARYAYDDLGRRVSLTRGNGLVTSYAYDAASRLSETTQAGAGIATVSGFLYDPASQIVRRDRSNAAYDWAGHANVDRPYGVNGLNQLTSSGSNELSYDGRGNLVSDGVRTFGYDSRDQLGNYRGGGQPDYLYHDMLGRLRQLSAEGVTLDYDGSQMVAEYDYSGPLLRRYVHGAGVDEPLVWYEGAGVADRRFLHADERGSIVAITDSAGRKLAILTYDEYGIPGPGNVLANGQAPRFQYTGQMWIASLGMYDYKARIYSPTLGRFLQADPIGYGDGLNLYGYVGGDPVNFVDPFGLEEQSPGIVITAIGCPAGDVRINDGCFSLSAAQIALRDYSLVADSFVVTGKPNKRKRRAPQNNNNCAAHPILGALGKINGSPNTALGLLAAGASYVAGKIAGTNPSFQIGNNAIQLTNSPLNINNRAYTLGNVQVYGVGDGPGRSQQSYTGAIVNIGAHESGHSNQSQILGLLYLPAEAIGSLFGDKNPLEVGADKFALGQSCSGF